MIYALVNGEIREAERGLVGECRGCGRTMLARSGSVRVKHWYHKGKVVCDPWLKNKTEWHIRWQNHFPIAWQEFRFVADSGEIHIADVKTDQDYVLEFQRSPISVSERQAREAFYRNLVWVVDATRRKNDWPQFEDALKDSVWVIAPVVKLRVFSKECALIRDWIGSNVPVFFDFGSDVGLWYLLSSSSDGRVYVTKIGHTEFINLLRGGVQMAQSLKVWMKELAELVLKLDMNNRVHIRQLVERRIPPVNHYQAFQNMRRRSFRL